MRKNTITFFFFFSKVILRKGNLNFIRRTYFAKVLYWMNDERYTESLIIYIAFKEKEKKRSYLDVFINAVQFIHNIIRTVVIKIECIFNVFFKKGNSHSTIE